MRHKNVICLSHLVIRNKQLENATTFNAFSFTEKTRKIYNLISFFTGNPSWGYSIMEQVILGIFACVIKRPSIGGNCFGPMRDETKL